MTCDVTPGGSVTSCDPLRCVAVSCGVDFETDSAETGTHQEQYVLPWRTMTAPFTAEKVAQHS